MTLQLQQYHSYDYFYYYVDKDMRMKGAPLLSLRPIPIVLRDSERCFRGPLQELLLDRTHSPLEPMHRF